MSVYNQFGLGTDVSSPVTVHGKIPCATRELVVQNRKTRRRIPRVKERRLRVRGRILLAKEEVPQKSFDGQQEMRHEMFLCHRVPN